MKSSQLIFEKNQWTELQPAVLNANLVFAFGASNLVNQQHVFETIREKFSNATIVSCSTSGEILDNKVYDDTVVVSAIAFEKTPIRSISTNFNDHPNSFEVGKYLMESLNTIDLNAVFIISDGSFINGSELVNGLNYNKPSHVLVTGGLAGDAARFKHTYVGLNEVASEGKIVAIGFYGNDIQIGHSSFGGWDEFGRERIVTKSNQNILYELDHENALDLYKEYLGPYVDELPGSALLFPLSIKINDETTNLVRTILTIDEQNKTMTFAGNLPEGSRVRLMKANFEKLIDASEKAATQTLGFTQNKTPDLALLISCVGRKLILQERTYEEVEAAKQIFGNQTLITGFYSYGEISPFNTSATCELHNQTMTITTFSEI